MTLRRFVNLTSAPLVLALAVAATPAAAQDDKPSDAPVHTGLQFINTSFENASPLYWETDEEGVIHIHMIYDQERSSPNRANGHWHFQLQACSSR